MRHLRGIVFLLAALLLLTACGEENLPTPAGAGEAPTSTAEVTIPTPQVPTDEPLQGTRWVLTNLHGEPLPPDLLAFMMVGVNGNYGMAGCIEGFPQAEFLDDGTVKPFDRPYLIEDRCGPDGPDDVSKAIIKAAASSKRYVHFPERLEMRDGDGEPVLIFRQVPTETELSETQWIPVTIGGEPVIGDTDFSLGFPGVWMSFHDGCNSGGGEYMVPDPGRIYVSEGEMTTQDCPEIVPGERDQRDRYLSIFRASSYQLTATKLELFDNQGNSLAEFEAKVVRYGLEDTRWNLTTMNGAPVHEDANITLNIGRQSIGGWSSCNEYLSSDLQFDRESIQNLLRSTNEEGCKPGMPEEEYYDTLMTVERYQLVGDRLTLLNATGQPVLEYRLDWDLSALTGTDWTAITYLGAPLEEPGSIRISFANDTFEIRAGCYLIQLYGLGIDGSKLTMTGGYHSSAADCDFTPEGQPAGVPPTISESVSSIAGYRFLDANQLELVNNAGEVIMVFLPAPR